MSDRTEYNLQALRQLLGTDLAEFAENIPTMMARELLINDTGFISRHQLSRSLLEKFTPDMKDWTSPDALRAILPETPFHRTRMQPIAGALAAVSCQAYPEFSYYPYIPLVSQVERRKSVPLIIAVHGSSRNPKDYRDQYATYAEEHGCFVLAPLFPMSLDNTIPDEEYKYLDGDRTRYDHVLWAMVDELASAANVDFSCIILFGFSGGAQFGHRLLYVCPDKIDALSIAAPGFITLASDQHDWWVGVRDLEQRFGQKFNPEALQDTAIQLICGADDRIDYEIYSQEELRLGDADYALYGRNRTARIQALKKSMEQIGLAPQLDFVEGTAHTLAPLIESSKPFISAVLKQNNF